METDMEEKEMHLTPQLIGDLLDIIHNAIIVVDSAGRIVFVNSRTAAMFRATVNELQGLNISGIFMSEDRQIMVGNILDITRKNREFEGEVMLLRPDGSSFVGLLAGTFFHWDDRMEGMAFTIHDITDMKSLERSLRLSEHIAFLGRLVEDISHQIRNPVTVIGGFSRKLTAVESCSKKALAIVKEATHLEALLDTLNHFIRLPRPCLKRIRMSEIIEGAKRRFAEKVAAMGCLWHIEYEKGIEQETLLVDKELLLQAVEAVIVNACESCSGDGVEKNVTLKIKHTDDPTLPYAILVVDGGIGIPRDNLDYIFSHFYTNKTKHIGMGLTLAERILDEQRGGITVDSTPGHGTTVTCHLVGERRRTIRTIRMDS